MSSINTSPKKILVIRRDNIGDLILSTPFLGALKQRFPNAQIDIFTNSYCAPVLVGNPDIDNVFVYEKGHHRGKRGLVSVYLDRARLIWKLRQARYDCIILGKPSVEPRPLQLARLIGAPQIIGITERGSRFEKYLTDPLYWSPDHGTHVAERCMQLLEPLGGTSPAGPLRIFPDNELAASFSALCRQRFGQERRLVGVQISARKLRQRWPVERFAALMKTLHERHNLAFALFWSPGTRDNPMHPGDDENAAALIELLPPDFPILPCPTQTLAELIAKLSTMHAMITSDGGALHIGAAAGLPILCFFGNSESARWHPWAVPYVLIQKDIADVGDITVEDAADGFEDLLAGASDQVSRPRQVGRKQR